MRKFSKYNVYVNCQKMCSLKEALEKIKDAKAEDLYVLEAKVALYNKYFKGYGNTEEEKTEFSKLETEMLIDAGICLEDFAEMVLEEIQKRDKEAKEEYLKRIKNIDKRLKDGEGEFEEIDAEIISDSVGTMTEFNRIKNCPVSLEYICNDEGISVFTKSGYEAISEPVSLIGIYKEKTGLENLELQYYDTYNEKVKTVLLPTKELAKNNFDALIARGVIIDNHKLFTGYLNTIKKLDRKKNMLFVGQAQMKYGYIPKEDGTNDFKNFIGLGKNKIVSTEDFRELDENIFKERGTLKGYLDFLSEVSRGKYQINFKLVIAASLSGITMAYVNNGLNIVAPPSYLFTGQTSIGKNLFFAIANMVFCLPSTSNSLIYNSDSSLSFLMAVKDHLNMLPLFIADIQDLVDKYGVESINEMIFNHSNGSSGGKCQNTGEIRQNHRYWANPLIMAGEADMFTGNNKISGGADARYTVINLNVDTGETLTEKPPKSYMNKESKNAGHLGKAYIEALADSDTSDLIPEIFQSITEELCEKGMQEKQANSFGLLLLTLNLLKENNLMPDDWDDVTVDELIKWVGIKQITNPVERMYELLCERVVKDVSYVPIFNEHFKETQEAFDWRSKKHDEVRGRLYYERFNKTSGKWEKCQKECRERTLLLIPKQQLDYLFSFLTEETGLKGFGFNQKDWVKRGWLLKASEKSYQFKQAHGIGITRPLDSKNRELYYAIIVREDK